MLLNEISGLNKQNHKLINDSKRAKIKLKQLSNEILSLNKRLKKHKHFFDVLIIDKGISISYIKQNKDKNCSDNQKQIRDYYDSTWALNYNNLLIGKNKQKEKYNWKNNTSNNNKKNNSINANISFNKLDNKSKSKVNKSNINKSNKNHMHINYLNKIQRNINNIMDIFHDQNDYLSPYEINHNEPGSLKKENYYKLKARETSPSPNDKLKYSTINNNNNKNKSQIILNANGNMEKIKLYRKIKDYHKLFDRKLSQITRNIMPKSIRRTLSALHNIRNSSPNFYDSYRNLCSNNIKNISKNNNSSLKRKNRYKQLNSSNSNNYHNISANSNKKRSINYFRKKTPHRISTQRKEITPNIKINKNFHNLYSSSNSKSKLQYNDNLKSSIDNSNQKKPIKKINLSNVSNISSSNNNNLNLYNSSKNSNKIQNLFNKDNDNLKNINKINNNNNIVDGMLNNVLIIANIKNKFEVNTVSHGINKHSSFKKFKYNFANNSVSSNK